MNRYRTAHSSSRMRPQAVAIARARAAALDDAVRFGAGLLLGVATLLLGLSLTLRLISP